MNRYADDLGPLDPCHALARGVLRSKVHTRHPDSTGLTLCGRTIDRGQQPSTSAPLGCRECRVTLAMIRDREARGLPRLCLAYSRPWWTSRRLVRCHQPVEGHRLRPDVDYDWPWHDGVELLDDDEDEDEDEKS